MSSSQTSGDDDPPKGTTSFADGLRKESDEKKRCAGEWTTQATTVGGVYVGAVLALSAEFPLAALAGPVISVLFVSTAKLASYKYRQSHRNLGYLLYTEDFGSAPPGGMGWEQAMRAWRAGAHVVARQVAARDIDEHAANDAPVGRRRHASKDEKVGDQPYSPGGYLRSLHDKLRLMSELSLTPCAVGVLALLRQSNRTLPHETYVSAAVLLGLAAVAFVVLWKAWTRVASERAVLETGHESIWVCARAWQIIDRAHAKAWDAESSPTAPRAYMRELQAHAIDLMAEQPPPRPST